LVYTARDLGAICDEEASMPGPFVWDSERRSLIRAELDATVFHLYNLARDDVEHIMSTFPVAESYEVRDFGEFRTRRLILERYDAMRSAAESCTPYMTILEPPPGDPPVAH
jgi:hypothetical protein